MIRLECSGGLSWLWKWVEGFLFEGGNENGMCIRLKDTGAVFISRVLQSKFFLYTFKPTLKLHEYLNILAYISARQEKNFIECSRFFFIKVKSLHRFKGWTFIHLSVHPYIVTSHLPFPFQCRFPFWLDTVDKEYKIHGYDRLLQFVTLTLVP